MSLITEINRTETEKNKVKKVATNIDNKLVELGGEQATDLADVPNKMEVMVKEYNRVATFDLAIKIPVNNNTQTVTIPTNTQFIPIFAFVEFNKRFGTQDSDTAKWDTRNGVRSWKDGAYLLAIKVGNPLFSKENVKFKLTSQAISTNIEIKKLTLIG